MRIDCSRTIYLEETFCQIKHLDGAITKCKSHYSHSRKITSKQSPPSSQALAYLTHESSTKIVRLGSCGRHIPSVMHILRRLLTGTFTIKLYDLISSRQGAYWSRDCWHFLLRDCISPIRGEIRLATWHKHVLWVWVIPHRSRCRVWNSSCMRSWSVPKTPTWLALWSMVHWRPLHICPWTYLRSWWPTCSIQQTSRSMGRAGSRIYNLQLMFQTL